MIEVLDENWMIIFCSYSIYVGTNQLQSSNIGCLLQIMNKIIQVWMITDNLIFGIGTYQTAKNLSILVVHGQSKGLLSSLPVG